MEGGGGVPLMASVLVRGMVLGFLAGFLDPFLPLFFPRFCLNLYGGWSYDECFCLFCILTVSCTIEHDFDFKIYGRLLITSNAINSKSSTHFKVKCDFDANTQKMCKPCSDSDIDSIQSLKSKIIFKTCFIR